MTGIREQILAVWRVREPLHEDGYLGEEDFKAIEHAYRNVRGDFSRGMRARINGIWRRCRKAPY